MSMNPSTLRSVLALCIAVLISACGGGGGGGGGSSSNLAEFVFDCDLNGLNGVLTMQVEALSASGIVWGSGPNPDITGVIGTGGVSYITSGTLQSSTAAYSFTGRDQFADMTALTRIENFRVEWVATAQGLTVIVNPFGPGPTSHDCVLLRSRRL
jgi:hypothetical protein